MSQTPIGPTPHDITSQNKNTQPFQNKPTTPPNSFYNHSDMIEQRTQTVMAPFCQQVEEAFRKQNAVNETFNARIGHLEETTDGIVKKIDLLLESLAPTARKAQRTTENMHCDAGEYSNSASIPSHGVHSNHDY